MMDPIEPRLAQHLDAGERLLWSGHPRQGLWVRRSDALLIPFSLLWGGFAFFWEAMVIRQGAPWFFALWGIPFVCTGAYLIAGRFFWDARRRSATCYGVTDRRVIILSGVRSPQVRSVNLRTLAEVSVREGRDGSGDIVLGASMPMSGVAASGWPGMSANSPPTLEGVSRARDVHTVIRQAQSRAA
jgi:hypothetical protein